MKGSGRGLLKEPAGPLPFALYLTNFQTTQGEKIVPIVGQDSNPAASGRNHQERQAKGWNSFFPWDRISIQPVELLPRKTRTTVVLRDSSLHDEEQTTPATAN